jgi:hypothetical protein
MFEINVNGLNERLESLIQKLSEIKSKNFPIIHTLLKEIESLKNNSKIFIMPHHVEDYAAEIISSEDNTINQISNRIILFEREFYTTDNKFLYYRFTEPNVFFIMTKTSESFVEIAKHYELKNIDNICLCLRQTEDGKYATTYEINSTITLKNIVLSEDENSIMKTSMPTDSYQSLVKNGIQENTNILRNLFLLSYSIGTDWICHPINEVNLWIPDFSTKASKILSAGEENKRKEKDQQIKIELDKFNRYDLRI